MYVASFLLTKDINSDSAWGWYNSVMTVIMREHVEYPFGKGELTPDGVQWSPTIQGQVGVWVEVEKVMIWPPDSGFVAQVDLDLTCAFFEPATLQDYAYYQWQGRDYDSSAWIALVGEASAFGGSGAWKTFVLKGRTKQVDGFRVVPCELRLVFKATIAGIAARTSSLCRVSFLYRGSK